MGYSPWAREEWDTTEVNERSTGLLDQMATLVSVLAEPFILFSTGAMQVCIPTQSVGGLPFPQCFPTFVPFVNFLTMVIL